MMAGYYREGWWEGVFHGGSGMEVEELALWGDFHPAGVTKIHGQTASFAAGVVGANRADATTQGGHTS